MVKRRATQPANPPQAGLLPGIPGVQQTDLDRQTLQKALRALRASIRRSGANHAPGTPLRAAYDAELVSCERLLAIYEKETTT